MANIQDIAQALMQGGMHEDEINEIFETAVARCDDTTAIYQEQIEESNSVAETLASLGAEEQAQQAQALAEDLTRAVEALAATKEQIEAAQQAFGAYAEQAGETRDRAVAIAENARG